VDAERAFLAELGGDCSLPAGAFAVSDGDDVLLRAFLASSDGQTMARVTVSGKDAAIGTEAARAVRAESGL
jgi:hydroxymethylbilane synthase